MLTGADFVTQLSALPEPSTLLGHLSAGVQPFLTLSAASGLALSLVWAGLLHLGLRRMSRLPYVFAFVSLLGTFLHELSHWLMGALLGAKPTSVRLFPYKEGDTWVLGSVSFARITWLNGAPVALAPLLLWALGPWALLGPMQNAWASGQYGAWLGWGYLCAVCLGSGWPSSVDWQLAARSLAIYALLGLLAWLSYAGALSL